MSSRSAGTIGLFLQKDKSSLLIAGVRVNGIFSFANVKKTTQKFPQTCFYRLQEGVSSSVNGSKV